MALGKCGLNEWWLLLSLSSVTILVVAQEPSLGASRPALPCGFHLVLNLFLCLPRRSRKDSLESDSSTAIIPHELIRTRQLESVHLKFNQESGALIPLCLR